MTDQTEIDALRGAPVTPGQLFIGGQWVEAADDARLDVISPLNGQLLTTIADAGPADVRRAVQAARLAFDRGDWSTMAPPPAASEFCCESLI